MTKYFIIPYRDREAEKAIFINHMSKILEDEDFKLIFVHQKDKRKLILASHDENSKKHWVFTYSQNEACHL